MLPVTNSTSGLIPRPRTSYYVRHGRNGLHHDRHSVKTRLTRAMIIRLSRVDTFGTVRRPFFRPDRGRIYVDELGGGGLIQPSLITSGKLVHHVNLDRGAGYGDTLTWTKNDRSKLGAQP